MENQPLVSVVMATFNEPLEFISSAIESILEQTYQNIELLILDDSTSEKVRSLIDSYESADMRVKVIRKNERMKFIPALNIGLQSANGKYVARMDADDISLKDRLEKQVDFMEMHPSVAVCGGAINIINEKNEITGERLYPLKCKWMAVYRNPLAHPTVIMRKENVNKGFIYDEKLKNAEDLDLWLRYIINGECICNLNEKLLYYRVCGDLAKKRGKEQFQATLKIRISNFSFKFLFFSVCSVIAGFLLTCLPLQIFSYLYKKENQSIKPDGK